MQSILDISPEYLSGKKVVVRCDMNVPLSRGKMSDDSRIRHSLVTLKYVLDCGGLVVVLSHLGRPKEGRQDGRFSLKPVAHRLGELLGMQIPLLASPEACLHHSFPSPLVFLENTRFFAGEKSNDDDLARRLAGLGEIFVMDAFGSAHRKHASTYGIARFSRHKLVGALVAEEIATLKRALENPERPLLAIIAGSKAADKISCIRELGRLADTLILGGAVANTYILANGYAVGKSIAESRQIEFLRSLNSSVITQRMATIPLPVDVVCADSLENPKQVVTLPIDQIPPDKMVVDVGFQTSDMYSNLIAQANTIIWNGPLGVFEIPAFSEGTRRLAHSIAKSKAFSLVGGGESVAALKQFGLEGQMSFISSGGGAFLEWIGKRSLVALSALT